MAGEGDDKPAKGEGGLGFDDLFGDMDANGNTRPRMKAVKPPAVAPAEPLPEAAPDPASSTPRLPTTGEFESIEIDVELDPETAQFVAPKAPAQATPSAAAPAPTTAPAQAPGETAEEEELGLEADDGPDGDHHHEESAATVMASLEEMMGDAGELQGLELDPDAAISVPAAGEVGSGTEDWEQPGSEWDVVSEISTMHEAFPPELLARQLAEDGRFGVLLVDEEPASRYGLSLHLEETGAHVEEVESLAEAPQMAGRLGFPIAVIADHGARQATADVVRRLRIGREGVRVLTIVVSDDTDPRVHRLFYEAGALGVMQLPVQREVLVERILDLANKRSRPEGRVARCHVPAEVIGRPKDAGPPAVMTRVSMRGAEISGLPGIPPTRTLGLRLSLPGGDLELWGAVNRFEVGGGGRVNVEFLDVERAVRERLCRLSEGFLAEADHDGKPPETIADPVLNGGQDPWHFRQAAASAIGEVEAAARLASGGALVEAPYTSGFEQADAELPPLAPAHRRKLPPFLSEISERERHAFGMSAKKDPIAEVIRQAVGVGMALNATTRALSPYVEGQRALPSEVIAHCHTLLGDGHRLVGTLREGAARPVPEGVPGTSTHLQFLAERLEQAADETEKALGRIHKIETPGADAVVRLVYRNPPAVRILMAMDEAVLRRIERSQGQEVPESADSEAAKADVFVAGLADWELQSFMPSAAEIDFPNRGAWTVVRANVVLRRWIEELGRMVTRDGEDAVEKAGRAIAVALRTTDAVMNASRDFVKSLTAAGQADLSHHIIGSNRLLTDSALNLRHIYGRLRPDSAGHFLTWARDRNLGLTSGDYGLPEADDDARLVDEVARKQLSGWVVGVTTTILLGLFVVSNFTKLGEGEYLLKPGHPFFHLRRVILLAGGLALMVSLRRIASLAPKPKQLFAFVPKAAGIAAALGIVMGILGPKTVVSINVAGAILLVVYHVFAEEIFFRAGLTTALLRISRSPGQALVASGAIYALYHLSFNSIFHHYPPLWQLYYCLLLGFGAGVPYAYLFMKGRSLVPPLIAHSVAYVLVTLLASPVPG